jgi:hypothetical protein
LLAEMGVPAFAEPESCASALSAMMSAAAFRPPVLADDGVALVLGELPSG